MCVNGFDDSMRRSDMERDSHDTWSGDTRRLRDAHADRYVLWLRPIISAFVVGLVLVTWLVRPGVVYPTDVLAVGVAAAVALLAIAARRVIPVTRVAALSGTVDMLLVLGYVIWSDEPAQSTILLCWPITVVAYFATTRLAIAASCVAAAALWIASATSSRWVEESVVPVSTYGLVGAALLIGFMAHQGRMVERALAAALARDRVAFMLARRIRMADDPHDALAQIAEGVGATAGATNAIVALLEHDETYVSEFATWSRTAGSPAPDPDVLGSSLLDSTLLHLVCSGHGAALEHGAIHVVAPEGSTESAAATGSAIEASLRSLLTRLGAQSGIVVPLPLAGHSIGAIVLAGDGDHDWSRTAMPLLEPLAPQLAAGLAQVVLVRDQRDALQSIERVDRMREHLIANVSHELRTPLTSTLGFVETALRDDIDLDARSVHELLTHARAGGLRLLALVEDLLALGSTQPDSLDISPEPARAADLIAAALRGVTAPAERSIVVRVEPDASVVADSNRVMQVVSNLVVNAIRHGEGAIEVDATTRGGRLLIDVLDDGDGVPPEHVRELFLPFSRFSTRSDSTGLGLAICRTIVEAHGGTIGYARIAGRTRFRVELPNAGAAG